MIRVKGDDPTPGGKRVMVVFGTRPEAIKLAPVILRLRASPVLEPVVVVTAQHRTMLDQVLDAFGIVPVADLDVIEPRQSLTDITVRAVARLSPMIAEDRPDLVLVQGDTTTTFVAALCAYYHQIPVAHLEAGLRTFDPYAPYPEEMNRRLTTQLAALHLAPTPTGRRHLLAEGIAASRIVVTGNTVIDALLWAASRQVPWSPELKGLDGDRRRVVLVTAHRRESWGEGMGSIARAVAAVARSEPDVLVVVSLHRNPVVREAVVPVIEHLGNVLLVEHQAYPVFARLMARAHLILTDSGGIQEEAPSLGKPVLVMRDKTERPEAVASGTAKLVGTDEHRIVAEVRGLLHDDRTHVARASRVNPYGDGRASERAVGALEHLLGLGDRPDDFNPPSGAHEPVAASDHPPA